MTTPGKTIKLPAFSFYCLKVSFLHSFPNYLELAFSANPCRQKVFKLTQDMTFHCCYIPFRLLLLFSGTSRRTKFFGTFPGNYVKRLWLTSLLIYNTFQPHICINPPETSQQTCCCHALWFSVGHYHLHLRQPPNHQQRDYCCEP